MKINFGEKELEIKRFMDTEDFRDIEYPRRVTVTLKASKAVDEISVLFADYAGNFSIINDTGTEEFTGFELSQIMRNIDQNSKETQIMFEKL